MKPLPPETLHISFEPGPYRMAMGLYAIPETEWFEIDTLYPADLALRRRLLTERHDDVYGATPRSAPARAEAFSMLLEHLTRVYPAWFERDGSTLRNHLNGEQWDIEAYEPLELAGLRNSGMDPDNLAK